VVLTSCLVIDKVKFVVPPCICRINPAAGPEIKLNLGRANRLKSGHVLCSLDIARAMLYFVS
jgi:hypothetical protein